MGATRAARRLRRDRPMVPAPGIGEGLPALRPGRPCRLLRVARRGGLHRRGGDRFGRDDDRRGNVRRRIPGGARSRRHPARSRPRRLLPGLRRPAALRVQAVDALRARLLRGRAGKLSRQAPVPRLRLGAGGGADRKRWRRHSRASPRTTCSPPSSFGRVLNVAGSAGDMLMMRKAMSYPGTTRFEDTGEGFVAYGPAEDVTARVNAHTTRSSRMGSPLWAAHTTRSP